MNCPFCQHPVLPKAYACGHCGRDLVPWLALMGQIELQSQNIERLEKALGLPPMVSMTSGSQSSAVDIQVPPPVLWHAPRLLWAVLGTTTGLVISHWLLLFIYDASPLILRLVTMALPLMVALAINARGDIDVRSNAIAGLSLALLGVGAMLGVTSLIDDVTWLPESKRDWIETFEYSAAILLAWVTGHLIGLSLNKGQRILHERRRIAQAHGLGFVPRVTEVSEQLQKLAAAAAPVASGLMAAYSGLKSILGDG